LKKGPNVKTEFLEIFWENWVFMNMLDEVSRIRKIMGLISENFKFTNEVPYDVIEYVFSTTPIGEYADIDDYYEYVNNFYSNYYVTQHTSPVDDILRGPVKTPEQRGVKEYLSADGFFVSPDININHNRSYSSSMNKSFDDVKNYIVMVPKDLKYMETDYSFSNFKGFMDDYGNDNSPEKNVYKYIGDKSRELGYDVIIPDGGKYEWIILNPSNLVVLGSKKDIKNYLNYKR